MTFEIEYFHERVLAEIEAWPVDVLADYARLVELLMEYGPHLRLPHSRAFGGGLFELRPKGRRELGARSTVSRLANASWCCKHLLRRLPKRRTVN